jgi:adenine-specific DNA-methyltransferase
LTASLSHSLCEQPLHSPCVLTVHREPYDKLKRALRADIDEAAWTSLYGTTSRSFDLPSTGKIAIKVINHYGDEVLKVFEV